MLVLAIMVCLVGFLAALLPHLPAGLSAWGILLAVSVVYPIVLQPTLRVNRADYEFRLLHWFPACILLLWAFLEVTSPRVKFLYILQLGFFYLWSLPIVVLGICFLMLFAVHVVRRSTVRVTLLSLLLAAFITGAVAAEIRDWNPRLQTVLFERQEELFALVDQRARGIVEVLQSRGWRIGGPGRSSSSSSSLYASSANASPVQISSFSSSAPSVMATKKPRRLAKSGPESVLVLFVTLVAVCSSVIHRRAHGRV